MLPTATTTISPGESRAKLPGSSTVRSGLQSLDGTKDEPVNNAANDALEHHFVTGGPAAYNGKFWQQRTTYNVAPQIVKNAHSCLALERVVSDRRSRFADRIRNFPERLCPLSAVRSNETGSIGQRAATKSSSARGCTARV